MSGYNFGSGGPSWNGISMINGMPAGLTKVFFVDYTIGSDGNKGTSSTKPFKTIQKALDSVTTNKNEGIALMGNASHVVTAMLDFSKSRVHMFGYDPGGRMYGQNAKVSMGETSVATDLGVMQNTGVRNSFSNIKFTSANVKEESIYSVVEAGEYAVYSNCEIYKETDLDVAGAAELVMNGDSAQLYNCTIGSLANKVTAAGARPCVLVTKGIVSGKVARDVSFVNCNFWRQCGSTSQNFVYGSGGTDVERLMIFENCKFINNKTATATPAQNIAFGATQTAGYVLATNCVSVGAATAMSTTTGVFVNGPVPAADTTGIALQAS